MRKLLLLAFVVLATLPASSSWSVIPHLINYQGMLTEPDGSTPVPDNPYDLGFKIYGSESGDDSLWWEYHSGVQVTSGLFNVILGSVNSLDLPFDANYWLEVIVAGETMPTRMQLISVGYAYRAERADTSDYASAAQMAAYSSVANQALSADSALRADTADYAFAALEALISADALHADRADTADYALAAPGAGADTDWEFLISDDADTSMITGGAWGIARYGAILRGNKDSTHVNLGVVCKTGSATSDNKYCTVSGGFNNTASGSNAAVGGGWNNIAGGLSAVISGGLDNRADGYYSTIGGGNLNRVPTDKHYATIAGGYADTANAYAASIGGGYANVAGDTAATIAGGRRNHANGHASTVAGGEDNLAGGNYSAVLGGYANIVDDTADYCYLFGIGSNLTQDSTFMVDVPHIRFGDETDGYEFPASDGSIDQVMATDGNGQLSWTTVSGSGSGWTDDGTVVRLTASSDSVGIGTDTPGEKLHIVGGKLQVNSDQVGGYYSRIEGSAITGGTAGGAPGTHHLHVKPGDNSSNLLLAEDGGDVGIGTATPQGALDITSVTGALIVPRMTTAQRDALTPVNGMIIYNTTLNMFNFYENGAWVTK